MKRNSKLRIIKLLLAAVFAALLLIPQPVDNPRIDMSVPVLALGIDPATEGLSASAQILLPAEGGGSADAGEVVSGSGKTLAEAFDNLGIALGRKPEFNHCGIIVLGKEYAKAGANSQLEYLLTTGIVSPNTNIAVSGNENAEEFIKALNEYGRKLTLTNLLRYTASGAQNYSCALIEYLRRKDAAVPCIKMGYSAHNSDPKPEDVGKPDEQFAGKNEPEPSANNNEQNLGGGGAAAKKEKEGGKQAMTESASMTAVFKDGRLINIWGKNETSGLALLDPRTRQGTIFIGENDEENQKDEEGESTQQIALRLDNKKVKIKTKFKDGKPVFCVKLKLGFTAENPNDAILLGRNLTEETKRYIENSILTTYAAARIDGCDVAGIEENFFRNRYKQYKELKQSGFNFLNESEIEIKSYIDIK